MREWNDVNNKKNTENIWSRLLAHGMRKEPGLDGILVTVGLCVIALLLCMVMKNSLADFISTIIQAMTNKAQTILDGITM